jgi:hypothetical protein
MCWAHENYQNYLQVPVFGTQLGSVVHWFPTHVILSGPPIFTYPLLHMTGTYAPDSTVLVVVPAVGKLYVPLSVSVEATDEFCRKLNMTVVLHWPVENAYFFIYHEKVSRKLMLG